MVHETQCIKLLLQSKSDPPVFWLGTTVERERHISHAVVCVTFCVWCPSPNFYFFCSGQGDTVVSILTDLNGFWTYENREVLVAETPDEAELWRWTTRFLKTRFWIWTRDCNRPLEPSVELLLWRRVTGEGRRILFYKTKAGFLWFVSCLSFLFFARGALWHSPLLSMRFLFCKLEIVYWDWKLTVCARI